MTYHVPEGVLLAIMDPMSSFEDRKKATLAIALDAWQQGWKDCAETIAEAIEHFPGELTAEMLTVLKNLLKEEAREDSDWGPGPGPEV